MNAPAAPATTGPSFRTKLTIAMMVVVSGVLAAALLFAQQNVGAEVKRDFERDFAAELDALAAVREVRHAALAERCQALARKPRIHAALEDNALDLLYPSARDELRDILAEASAEPELPSAARHGWQARYYRFLGPAGRVIPGAQGEAGALGADDEARLSLAQLPVAPQSGFLHRSAGGPGGTIDELLVMPIRASDTGEVIAALALAFRPTDLNRQRRSELRPGLWIDGQLHLTALPEDVRASLAAQIAARIQSGETVAANFRTELAGASHLLFYRWLNPGSLFPPAYEVCLYPLAALEARQQRLVWQFVIAGLLLIGGGWVVSNFFSLRLARPVEKLASDSVRDREQRTQAELRLALKQEELQRSARFSADASHQLKTPVTVLRAGLEELLATAELRPEMRDEVNALVRQTQRLTTVIEDLLLLSRLDAGRLQLTFAPVDLSTLLDGWLDDFGALPDPWQLQIEVQYPAGLWVRGERRYTSMILQNLLDNARKYNRPGGRLHVSAHRDAAQVVLVIGNTGATIPGEAHERIFDRFHRGGIGENVPGHGLGLNLARELVRLHGGELRLTRSAGDWTEFEVHFPAAPAPSLQ